MNVSGNPSCEKRKPEIFSELDSLEVEIVKLRERLEDLQQKLAPILVNLPTASSVSNDKCQVATNTAIGKIIRDKSIAIEQMNTGVISLLERIEV